MTEALTSEVCVPLCGSTISVLQEAADDADVSVADLVRSICNEWAIMHLMDKMATAREEKTEKM